MLEAGGHGGTCPTPPPPPPPPDFLERGHRVVEFLRSSMSQVFFNNVMLLHIHKDKTDNIHLETIANRFISVNDKLLWSVDVFVTVHPPTKFNNC